MKHVIASALLGIMIGSFGVAHADCQMPDGNSQDGALVPAYMLPLCSSTAKELVTGPTETVSTTNQIPETAAKQEIVKPKLPAKSGKKPVKS